MRLPAASLCLTLALTACGKSAEERRVDVELCSASSTEPAAITRCLREQGGWRAAAAESAGLARAHELDSVRAEIGALNAKSDSQHMAELGACDQVLVDLKTCLLTRFGWEEDQATRADDSLWNSRSAEHQRQIRACLGPRGVGTGACLQLHYKWLPRRALALDDSIRRANLP
ncbi:MAG TPA: hypothetical protein VKO86_01245 [Gemmatimonadales bacterium]|nr:hypothetical protein [Gemmatimonadales bacterium]